MDGPFLGVAQFCTASAGKGLMAMTIAAGGGDGLQACGYVAEETYGRNEDQSAHGEGVKIEATREAGGRRLAHVPSWDGKGRKTHRSKANEQLLRKF